MSGVRPIPSNEFCRKLHRFDPDLRTTWNDGMACWQIWCENSETKELSHVMNVIENDGTFRPLDDRVFPILIRNRWYADHPGELSVDMVDRYVEKAEKERADKMENLRHLAKDPALKRRFEKAREMAGFVDRREWTTPRTLFGPDGKPLRNSEGTEVQYIPHDSLTE